MVLGGDFIEMLSNVKKWWVGPFYILDIAY